MAMGWETTATTAATCRTLNPDQGWSDEDDDGIGDVCDGLEIRGGGALVRGCAVVPPGAGWAGLLVVAGLGMRRRRRAA